jgi:hypothetical protein
MKRSFSAALLLATALVSLPVMAEEKPAEAAKPAASAPAAATKDYTILKVGADAKTGHHANLHGR